MFDPIGAFTKQFTPIEDDYLYYPSKKSGGKLVTADEFERLTADWERAAGRTGQWKTAGLIIIAIILFTLATQFLVLPDWANTLCILTVVVGVSGRFLWASFAPRRLVSDRAAITQPRQLSQVKQDVRALLNWPLVISAIIMSSAIFIGILDVVERTVVSRLWLVGSGLTLGAYLWIGYQKLKDRRR